MIITLETLPFAAIHAAFAEAFGDYVIPFRSSEQELRRMLTRRGWDPALSVAEVENGRIAGFTLNGRGTWGGEPAAYDSGTGVIPSRRRRGVARRLMEAAIERVREEGLATYLLEVITINEGAVRLYLDLGFEVTRRFGCWQLDAAPSRATVPVERGAGIDWDTVERWHEAVPSWQNGRESLERAASDRELLVVRDGGELVGYAAVVPASRDLAQLAVSPEHRRRGIGSALAAAAVASAGGAVRVVNVDTRAAGTVAFLRQLGAVPTVDQFEMRRNA